MADPILHHYPNSPFAEKARLLLGFKAIPWRSVTIPRIAPKPDLMPLTGGYRKTPVVQFGADIYCDTACIARELERRFPTPTLHPDGDRGNGVMMAAWADRTLFLTVVGVVFGTLGDAVPRELREDRLKFSAGLIDLDRYQREQDHLRAQLRSQLFWIERAFDDGRQWVLGAAPSYVDFCVYAPLWMTSRVSQLELLADMPRTREWMARVAGCGHGTFLDTDPKLALEIARDAEPAPIDLDHIEWPPGLGAGAPVTVAADDYGKDPVAGRLLAVNAQHIVIAREDPTVGLVHVHFPRFGFRIEPA